MPWPTATDPWDGRPSREAAFIARVRAMAPGADIRDLDPILDVMRFVKSPREIAVMREITRITGVGIMEAMREASPGTLEYELSAAAEWVFRRHNSQGPAYFPALRRRAQHDLLALPSRTAQARRRRDGAVRLRA